MTAREAAAAIIRLVGLYLAGRVVALAASLLAMPFLLSSRAFTASDPLLAASLGSAVGNAVLAAIAWTGADTIACRVCPATPLSLSLGRRDVLTVGIVILGLWVATDAAVALARAAAAAIFYARLEVPRSSIERSWPMLVVQGATLVMGVIAAWQSPALARRVDPER